MEDSTQHLSYPHPASSKTRHTKRRDKVPRLPLHTERVLTVLQRIQHVSIWQISTDDTKLWSHIYEVHFILNATLKHSICRAPANSELLNSRRLITKKFGCFFSQRALNLLQAVPILRYGFYAPSFRRRLSKATSPKGVDSARHRHLCQRFTNITSNFPQSSTRRHRTWPQSSEKHQ